MKYEDLKEGMLLICHQTNGIDKMIRVVRKGFDGFGTESVVFQSCSSAAQSYCKKEDVTLWKIEPLRTIMQ